MIKITLDDFDKIYPILKSFASINPRLKDLSEEDQKIRLKQFMGQEGMDFYGVEDENSEISAIVLITLHDTYEFAWNIGLLLTLEEGLSTETILSLKKQIMDKAITFLQEKPEVKILNIGGNISFEGDSEFYHERNFKKYNRAKMEISQEKIIGNSLKEHYDEIIKKKNVPFIEWDDKYIQSTAELCLDHGQNNLDNEIFPYFLNEQCTQKFMTLLLANKWGKFDPKTSFLLLKDNIPIGACFITTLQPKRGYIPYIRIFPKYNSLGFGKSLLYKSLLSVFKANADWNFIDLDVTYGNFALNLYKSLGFEITREYSLWNFRK